MKTQICKSLVITSFFELNLNLTWSKYGKVANLYIFSYGVNINLISWFLTDRHLVDMFLAWFDSIPVQDCVMVAVASTRIVRGECCGKEQCSKCRARKRDLQGAVKRSILDPKQIVFSLIYLPQY